jgi:hypothetical protein
LAEELAQLNFLPSQLSGLLGRRFCRSGVSAPLKQALWQYVNETFYHIMSLFPMFEPMLTLKLKYGYNTTDTWLRTPPTIITSDWSNSVGKSLHIWNRGDKAVGCWGLGFALMPVDFSHFWRTVVDGTLSCGVDQDSDIVWVEQRFANASEDRLVGYRLNTVTATTEAEPTGVVVSIASCTPAANAKITISGSILVLICDNGQGYMDVRGTNPVFKMSPRFGPLYARRVLPLINTTNWYIPGPTGIEKWSVTNVHPELEAISASGFSTVRIVDYANNPSSGTLYWLENDAFSMEGQPSASTLYQLGSSPSAFLNPVPVSVVMIIPGTYSRFIAIDDTINRLLSFFEYPVGDTGIPGADLGMFAFGGCNQAAVTCSECVADGDLECGWCATGSITGSCVAARECSTRWFQDVCPRLSGVTTIDALVTGMPFVLQLDSSLFQGENITCNLRSTTSSQLISLSVIPAAAPLCGVAAPTDPRLQTIAGAYTVDVTLDGFIVYPDPQPVSFVNCSAQTSCSSCTLASDACDWCVYDGLCVNSATSCAVSGPASQRPTLPGACPVQGPTTPSASILPLPVGATVNIQATSLIIPANTAGAVYTCRFQLESGPILTSAGSFLSASTGVQCLIPSPPGSYTGHANVTLMFSGHPFADNHNDFAFYDCTSATFTSCSQCLAADNALCGWNAASSRCGLASSCPAGSDCRSACPTITALNQSSFHLTGDVGTGVIIDGTYFTATNPTAWTCEFVGVGTTPATRTSGTQITCAAPTFTDGTYFTTTRTIYNTKLTIKHDNIKYADPVNVNWYTCAGLNCSSCLNIDLAPKCRWNFDAYTCATGGSELPACPRIQSMSDTFAHVSGGLSLDVTAEATPSGSISYRCAWTSFSNSIANVYQTASLNANVWTCATPDVTTMTADTKVTAKFSIQGQSTGAGSFIDYTSNPIDFTFLDCSTSNTCSSCLLSSQCSWVNYTTCTSTSTTYDVDPITGSCPRVLSITPTIQSVSAPITAIAIVENFPNPDWANTYKCRWTTPKGSVIRTEITKINATALSCPFQRTYHDLNTAILKFDIIQGTSTRLTANQLDYEVYDCTTATSCGLCSQIHPKCGWCAEIASCLDNSTCSAQTSGNSWAREGCPYIENMMPPFTALGRAQTVTFTGQFYNAMADVKCRYRYGNVDELVTATTTSTTVLCALPTFSSESTLSIEVGQVMNLKRIPTFVSYVPDVFSFDFFSCAPPSNQSDCVECSGSGLDPRCGWCTYDSICADAYSCDPAHPKHSTTPNACPQMQSLSPATGPLKGGTTVTVSGTDFIAGEEGTACRFGSQVVPAKVDSQSTLTCTSPAASSLGIKKSGQSVDVDILWNNARFTRAAGFKFTYKNQDSTATIAIATVLSVFFFLVIIVVILFVIFYKKIMEKRNRRRFLKLREPDYNAVAFAQTKGIEMTLTPSDLKSLSSFIRALEKDATYNIVLALSQSAPGSQADYLARAAVYFYQSRGRALDMLMTFVSAEVRASEHEGTLFRASSFACKLFNQYARYHGLPYLWKTLGFYVNQLAEFAKEERTEERDDILGPGSMEVDPDRFEDEALAPSEFDIRLNQYELLTRASKILKAIFSSLPYMRPEFRQLCARVKDEVGGKFPDNNADYKAVGGFIFLRFLCPSIMAPHVYGLVQTPPNETAQRYFVLLAKSLQNLANETLPGTNEDFMARMNEFITKNIQPLHMWVDNLCNGADSAVSSDPDLVIPDNLVSSSVAVMQHIVVEEWDNIIKHLPEEQINDLERVKEKGPVGRKPKTGGSTKSGAPPRRNK